MTCTQQILASACPAPSDLLPQTGQDRSNSIAMTCTTTTVDSEAEALIRQIRNGETGPFFTWAFREVFPHVRIRLGKKGMPADAASDLFTDAVLDLIGGVQKNNALTGHNLAGYLWRICRNKHADLHREKKRRQSEATYQQWVSTPPDLDAALMAESLHSQVQRLPSSFQQILTLYYFKGFSCGEIAAVLNSTADSVKERKCRAMKQLRAICGPRF